MKKSDILERSFIEARSQLLDVAAFLDRLQRASGDADYRVVSFNACLPILSDSAPDKARRILELLSDPTTQPVNRAQSQGASGAWPEFNAD